MMPIINFTDPATVLLTVLLFVLVVFLGKEVKKSIIPGLLLVAFLALLVGHLIEYSMVDIASQEIAATIVRCMGYDLVFCTLTFFSYLWIDDVQAKAEKKKSIDNSLDWFWGKVTINNDKTSNVETK